MIGFNGKSGAVHVPYMGKWMANSYKCLDAAIFREVFFADERIVPLDHEDSNFKLNNDTLFSKVPIMRRNIHTINPDLLDNPEELAECVSSTLPGQIRKAN